MKDDVEVLGPLERTARAFMLDASEAMRGDITRAIVEYVTNADDAYTRKGAKGRIVVEVEHRRSTEPWKVTIRDRATGMSLLEMRERIGRQGGRTADFGRLSVRGNLGLGSKDPACFGRVTFYSIKEHKFSWFSIDDQGQRTAARKELECTDEIRESLGIVRGNGTVVTIEVLHPTSCPRHDNLKNILRNHFLLRSIVEDPDREVLLLHANKQGAKPERLHWQPQKAAVKVNKRNLPVPEYPDARVDVLIAEADESFADEGRRSPTRGSGLLIRGRRAIYDCTLFSFEGNPYAACFCGSLQCDYIDRLAEEFDERVDKRIQHTVDNPIPIISRRREGLAEEHPFVKALKRLAEAELGPLITERERRAKERSRTVQSERTTRLFSQLAREAAKFIQEAADAEELELAFTGSGEKPAPLLAIVPRAIELPVDSEHILTIMAAKGDAYELAVSIEFSPPGLVNSPSTTLKLRPSRRRSDVLTSTIKVSSGPVVGATLLVARLDSITADCAIEVIEATQVPEPLPPASLEFERSRYRLVVNKPKPLLVRAPIDLYAEGASIRVTSNHASVVILDGGKAVLRTRRGSALMEGEIRVEGREVIDRAVLTASDGLGVSAEAVVTVVRREEAGNDFKTELVPEVQGDQRAQWSTDYRTLRIMGEHLAVKPYLGKVEDNYPGQDSHEFRVLLAEILSDAVVRRILLEKYKEDEMDIGTLYVQQYKLMAQLLARAHRIVAAAPER